MGVFLLVVSSLLALSSTADTEASLTALNREVRQAGKGARGKRNLKRGTKKRNGRKGKKSGKKKGLKEGQRSKESKGGILKGGKGNRKKPNNNRRPKKRTVKEKRKKLNNGNRSKGRTEKSKKNEGINRSDDDCGCACFYSQENQDEADKPNNVNNLRKATNRLRQAKRALKNINKTFKKWEKSVDFFEDGAKFFKYCNAPNASFIYNTLRNCSASAREACDPEPAIRQYGDMGFSVEEGKRALNDCISALQTTTTSSNKCLQVGCSGCNYKNFNFDEFDGLCDTPLFELDEKMKYVKGNCTANGELGSFAYCTGLLKESYDIAKICSCSTSTTTTTKNPCAADGCNICSSIKIEIYIQISIRLARDLRANEVAVTVCLTLVLQLAGTRNTRAVAADCSEVISKLETLIETINNNTGDESIVTLSQEISSVDDSVKCSPAERANLTTLANDLDNAAKNIAANLTEVLNELEKLTGSTPSP